MTSEAMDHTALRRDLRLVDAVAIGLGAIIGAGIFVGAVGADAMGKTASPLKAAAAAPADSSNVGGA